MVTPGGVHGCSGGGHVWLLPGGGMHGCSRGGGRAWDTRYGDTINERAVRILLECILFLCFIFQVKTLSILANNTQFI